MENLSPSSFGLSHNTIDPWLISHSSTGWEVQDRASADLESSLEMAKRSLFPHRMEGTGGSSRVPFITTLEVKVAQLCPWLFATPWAIQSVEFSRPEYWSGWPFPSPGNLPNPGIELRSPMLQEDSLPAEPLGKPKNTGVGSLLQKIFPTQASNWGLLHCSWILYLLSLHGSWRTLIPWRNLHPNDLSNSQRYLLQIPSPWELELKYLNSEVTQEHKRSVYDNHQTEQI